MNRLEQAVNRLTGEEEYLNYHGHPAGRKYLGRLDDTQTEMAAKGHADEGSVRNPYRHGSNAYFSDVGADNGFINDLVRNYGKDALKSSARIAYDAGIREGNPSMFSILFRFISILGEEATRNLIFRVGISPDELTDYSLRRKSDVHILTPKDVGAIVNGASVRNIQHMLARKGIILVYSNPTFMAFGYASR